jgi:PAS domain S-box-containing protein
VRRLTQAIRSYQNNNENTFKHNLDGEDEIAIAAREFDSMSGRLERQMVEIQRTHDLIRQSEQRWKLALEGVGDGVWDWNIETNEAEFSVNWKGMLGFENDEFENTFERWAEHLHPEDLPIAKQKLDDYLAGRAKSYRVEFRMRCKDGSWKWILSRGFVISRNRDLNPSRMIGTHTDISAQKEIEFKIQQGSDQLIDMLNLSPVAVRITDSNRRVLYANTAYRELIEIQGTLDNIDPWDYYTNKNDYREILDEIERGKQVRNKLLQISVYDRGDKWVLASYARIEHS